MLKATAQGPTRGGSVRWLDSGGCETATEDGLASVSSGSARSCLLFLPGVHFFQSFLSKQPKKPKRHSAIRAAWWIHNILKSSLVHVLKFHFVMKHLPSYFKIRNPSQQMQPRGLGCLPAACYPAWLQLSCLWVTLAKLGGKLSPLG